VGPVPHLELDLNNLDLSNTGLVRIWAPNNDPISSFSAERVVVFFASYLSYVRVAIKPELILPLFLGAARSRILVNTVTSTGWLRRLIFKSYAWKCQKSSFFLLMQGYTASQLATGSLDKLRSGAFLPLGSGMNFFRIPDPEGL
jgi:hypothetical protein